ncbi:Uncharacterized protein Fot_19084 [Forsythia ovata]|uniref:Uncharacterized protein n=1 Tax=Forsythia ovata TaxID=205694 RepID=A0ABD1VM45_9LAMI
MELRFKRKHELRALWPEKGTPSPERWDEVDGTADKTFTYTQIKYTQIFHRYTRIIHAAATGRLPFTAAAGPPKKWKSLFKLFKEGKVITNFKERRKTADLRG